MKVVCGCLVITLAFAESSHSDDFGLLQQKAVAQHLQNPSTGNAADGTSCPCGSCSQGCAPTETTPVCTPVAGKFNNGERYMSDGTPGGSDCHHKQCGMYWIRSCEDCAEHSVWLDFPSNSTNADRLGGPAACNEDHANHVCACQPGTGGVTVDLMDCSNRIPALVSVQLDGQEMYDDWVNWCNNDEFCGDHDKIDHFACHLHCKCNPTSVGVPDSGAVITYPKVGDYCDGMFSCGGPDGFDCSNVEQNVQFPDYRYFSADECEDFFPMGTAAGTPRGCGMYSGQDVTPMVSTYRGTCCIPDSGSLPGAYDHWTCEDAIGHCGNWNFGEASCCHCQQL